MIPHGHLLGVVKVLNPSLVYIMQTWRHPEIYIGMINYYKGLYVKH